TRPGPDFPDRVSPAIPPEAALRSSLRLGALGPVLASSPLAPLHTHGVEGPAHDVVAHARQVLHAAAPDEHDGVLLQVVADAREVRRDLDAVGEPHPRHLAERGVRLLRGRREDADAHAPLLRRSLEGRAVGLGAQLLTTDPDQLANRGHSRLLETLLVMMGRP